MKTTNFLLKSTASSLAAFLIAMTFACAPSVESETRNWKRNKENAKELMKEYPQFSQYIKADLEKAKTAWAEAEKIEPEEKKAEAMDQANEILDSRMFRQLNAIESRNQNIDSTIETLAGRSFSKNVANAINVEIQEARDLQYEANSLLVNTNPTSRESAANIIDEATSILIDAADAASQAKKESRKKK